MSVDFIGLGMRIKYFRNKLGYSQAELAEKTGLSEKQIYRVENGERGISIEKFMDIANVLKTTPNDLLADSIIKDGQNNTTDIAILLMDCTVSEIKFLKRIFTYFEEVIDNIDL